MYTVPELTEAQVALFWSKVEKTEGCWLWRGSLSPCGYGNFRPIRTANMRAHRVAYELLVGPISDGLFLCHVCDVRACVRPGHLFPGTQRENLSDMSRKGRGRNQNSGKTECKHGHPLTSENVYVYRDGHRGCRACLRREALASYHRKRRDSAQEMIA